MKIDWDVPISMDDGVILRADLFRPEGSGEWPVLLSYGPYGKGLSFQDGYPDQWAALVDAYPEVLEGSTGRYQNWETVDPEKWVPDGYACLRVDSRGAGRSPGFLDCSSRREARDLYDCIEWAAAQPWSNGRIGLAGISYYAMNQWQVAMLQPPHLAAICPWEGSADYYRDVTHHGGILSTFEPNWYLEQVVEIQHGFGDRGQTHPHTGELVSGPTTLGNEDLERNRLDLGREIRSRPFDGDFYRCRSVDWSRVSVPFLSCANWGGQGLHLRGNLAGFREAASEQKWLEVHGEAHWMLFYTDYGRGLQRRFFDHFLKGEDNGWDAEPPVLLQVRSPGERFHPRTEREWPLARTQWTPYYLSQGGAFGPGTPAVAGGAETYTALEEGLTYSTEPLGEELEITGPIAAKLFVSSTTEDADLFVVLRVFDPEDREVTFQGALDPHTPVAQGWLRASHRALDPERSTPFQPHHPHRQADPLVPGAVYELDIEVWPTCIVIPAGYRLAVTVQGHDYVYDPEAVTVGWFVMRGSGPFLHDDPADRPEDVFGGRVTLHTGSDHPSHLLLPVIPPLG